MGSCGWLLLLVLLLGEVGVGVVVRRGVARRGLGRWRCWRRVVVFDEGGSEEEVGL